jgi:hypothetical protein
MVGKVAYKALKQRVEICINEVEQKVHGLLAKTGKRAFIFAG